MRQWLLYLALSSGAMFALRLIAGASWGLSALLAFVGWPVLGTLITIDDDFPNGWSNPDGNVRPPWLMSPFWGQISVGLAIAALVSALEAGFRSDSGVLFIAGSLVAVAGAVVLLRRRPGGNQ
jgi:hypothetical protein